MKKVKDKAEWLRSHIPIGKASQFENSRTIILEIPQQENKEEQKKLYVYGTSRVRKIIGTALYLLLVIGLTAFLYKSTWDESTILMNYLIFMLLLTIIIGAGYEAHRLLTKERKAIILDMTCLRLDKNRIFLWAEIDDLIVKGYELFGEVGGNYSWYIIFRWKGRIIDYDLQHINTGERLLSLYNEPQNLVSSIAKFWPND